MNKIYLSILMGIVTMSTQAQLLPEAGDISAFGLGAVGEAEEMPVIMTEDIWPAPMLETDRSVVWVHGLGGKGDLSATDETNSWITASSESELNYKLQSRRPDYSDVDLSYAALQLRTQMEDADLTEDAYIIAHSQGGIVSRELDKMIDELGFSRTFNGVVTFGTPHQGALILNNRDDLYGMIGSMCERLGDGPWKDKFSDGPFFTALSLFTGIDNRMDNVCDLLVERVVPFVFDLDTYYAGITDGYYVGSPELAELNSYTPDIPYVAFWGEETEPVMYNTLVHLLPGREPNSELYGPFGANNDSYLCEQFNSLKNDYYANYEAHMEKKREILPMLGDGVGVLLESLLGVVDAVGDILWDVYDIEADYYTHGELAAAWYNGYSWLQYSNDNWKVIIGGLEYVYDTTAHCLCVGIFDDYELIYDYEDIDALGYSSCAEVEFYYEPYSDCEDVVNLALIDIISYVNDGIVTRESASSAPGLTYSKKMIGSNHFSMRNDLNTHDRLQELFAGDMGDYFVIDDRD